MPNMDGLTMLAAIRSEFPEIQMSVLTAYRDFEYARKAITLGVCRYLLKPSDLEELKEAVRQMVSRLDAMPGIREDSPEDETVKEAGNHLVKAALAYMKDHCTEQHLSLSDVADHVYVSQWHLSKLLNRETSQSFFDLLGTMRVAKAKELLKDPAKRIHEIAEDTGFSDVAHFSRSFKTVLPVLFLYRGRRTDRPGLPGYRPGCHVHPPRGTGYVHEADLPAAARADEPGLRPAPV